MTGTMKAIVLSKFGGFDAFEMRDVTVPSVGPRQVRVRVHATAINPLLTGYLKDRPKWQVSAAPGSKRDLCVLSCVSGLRRAGFTMLLEYRAAP